MATTDSNHGGPILPSLAREMVVIGSDQLWVADLTYVTVAGGFVYVAIILHAWSRRVATHSADSSTLASPLRRFALASSAVLRAGLLHHSDRGS